MKNPFKKQSIMTTVVNVGVGGAANVGFNYLYDQIGLGWGETAKNAIKIAGGAILGSMVKNQYLRAAADGIAVVGVSDLVASYVGGTTTTTSTPAGLPNGMIGRIRLGQKGFHRASVRGVGDTPSALMTK